MRRLKSAVPALVIAAALAMPGAARACPNCKEAVANQPGSDAAAMRDGYFWSILLMMGMPFGMLSAGTLLVVRAVKRGALPEL